MRQGELGQNGAVTEQEPRLVGAPVAVKEIPYDYVATFRLTGVPGHRVQDVITISTEGAFIAVAIGYSFAPDPLKQSVTFGALSAGTPPRTTPSFPVTVVGGSIPALFGLFQGLPSAAFTGNPPTPADRLAATVVMAQFRALCGIDFKYSLVDSGSGRELQNQPIHNIAGLGRADGDRPFRPFARPALFQPRSTIRIEVEEISAGALYRDGLLYIVLQGYKRLGE